jgi:putative sterol carrier protein
MTATIDEFLPLLQQKAAGQIEGTVKLIFSDGGIIWLDETGAQKVEDDDAGEADVTMTASAEVFQEIFEGERNPMTAFMTGALKVDGSTTRALKVSAILTDE